MHNFFSTIFKAMQSVQQKTTWKKLMNLENMEETAKKTLKSHFKSDVNLVSESCVETR